MATDQVDRQLALETFAPRTVALQPAWKRPRPGFCDAREAPACHPFHSGCNAISALPVAARGRNSTWASKGDSLFRPPDERTSR
jgi:hypothetical protein